MSDSKLIFLKRRSPALFMLALLLAFWAAPSAQARTVQAQRATAISGLAPAPPMGWANWNRYFCDYNAQTIRQQANALVSSGMRDLGYKYVLIQECIAPSRDASGNLVVDPARFPQGIQPLVEYLHSLGLKAGIYTDVGPYTCYDHPGDPRYQGSFGHEAQDAKTFAAWGIDLVEMDYCNKPAGHSGREIYERMGEAIRKSGRPMLFYLCSWGNLRPWEWAQGTAELWRTTTDISDKKNRAFWDRIVHNFESNAQHAVFSAPNSWNDPDMLEVGNPGLSTREARSHFSMWAISAAPLWAGTDLTRMDAATRAIYTNSEVIAVDQDPLGAGPRKIRGEINGTQVWAKPLASRGSGEVAVLLLNLSEVPRTISVRWSDLGLLPRAQVRDLWAHRDLGRFPDSFSAQVPPHGSRLIKVSGRFDWEQGATFEAEWPGNLRSGNAKLLECGECSHGFAVSIGGTTQGGQAAEAGTIAFRQLNVPQTGQYTMQLTYVRNGLHNQTIHVRVNDAAPVSVQVPSRVWSWIDIPVTLNAGGNIVAVSASGKFLVNIDKIRLYR